MRVVVLNDTDESVRNQFRGFVPKEFEGLMADGSAFMLGTVEADKDGLEAAGITLVAVEEEEFVLKWVWVDPDLRNKEAGSKMMDALFETANENGLETVIIQIPSLKDKYATESDTYNFFFEFAFGDMEIKEVNGLRVMELTADVNDYLNMENEAINSDIQEEKIDKAYAKFPKKFVVSGVEYFSGVPFEE